jgi:hypothetical protein
MRQPPHRSSLRNSRRTPPYPLEGPAKSQGPEFQSLPPDPSLSKIVPEVDTLSLKKRSA